MEQNFNLALSIYRHALETPNNTAVVCSGYAVTYAVFAERAARLAECLKTANGWRGNGGSQLPRVGILASRNIDACVAMVGACWAGATYVPLGPKFPEERILTLLSLCNFTALIADEEGAKLLKGRVLDACPGLVIYSGKLLEGPTAGRVNLVAAETLPPAAIAEPASMAAQDNAYIIFTSGTTGIPKGVVISAGAARHYLASIGDWLGLRASDRVLETCELTFDFSVHNLFATWEVGASLHILPAPQVMNAVKFARTSRLTVWNSVPSLAGMLRQLKALSPACLPDLRITVFGGEQLPSSTASAWKSAAPASAIFNLYGPTEATVFCLAQAEPLAVTAGRDVISIGRPLAGSEAAIFDELGAVVVDGTAGELAIAGVQLADGYLDAPGLTAERFVTLNGKRWYLTGDLALRDILGDFHCLGRIDNQVKIMGYRVELEEIDAHLRRATEIDLVGSVPWPIVDGSARSLVGFVGVPGGQAIDVDRVIARLKANIPAYMVPNRIVALESMPVNASGKVDRRALREMLEKDAV
ncbi:MAG: amino acid adenylation domain-containing protein [Rhodoferax sp.]|uniref:amino acid adenylation domain-containing protein n=1 Tax=Rhodoferax sp. TaxID=50421 RepID=UPI00326685D6